MFRQFGNHETNVTPFERPFLTAAYNRPHPFNVRRSAERPVSTSAVTAKCDYAAFMDGHVVNVIS